MIRIFPAAVCGGYYSSSQGNSSWEYCFTPPPSSHQMCMTKFDRLIQVNGSPEDAGIIPRAVTDLFKRMDELRADGVKAAVHASFMEVSIISYTGIKVKERDTAVYGVHHDLVELLGLNTAVPLRTALISVSHHILRLVFERLLLVGRSLLTSEGHVRKKKSRPWLRTAAATHQATYRHVHFTIISPVLPNLTI